MWLRRKLSTVQGFPVELHFQKCALQKNSRVIPAKRMLWKTNFWQIVMLEMPVDFQKQVLSENAAGCRAQVHQIALFNCPQCAPNDTLLSVIISIGQYENRWLIFIFAICLPSDEKCLFSCVSAVRAVEVSATNTCFSQRDPVTLFVKPFL